MFDTEIHPVTFLFLFIQSNIILPSFLWYLKDRSDISRLRFTVVCVLFFLYNLANGLVPSDNIDLPILSQNIIGWLCGVSNAIFYMYYLYTDMQVALYSKLPIKWILIFLVFCFVVLFIIPYTVTDNLELIRNIYLITTVTVGCFIFLDVMLSLKNQYVTLEDKRSTIVAVFCMCSVLLFPIVIIIFGDNQLIEHTTFNVGYLALLYLFIYKLFYGSEYLKKINLLIPSERKLVYKMLESPDMTFKEIGIDSNKSANTLRKQASSIYKTLNVQNRRQLFVEYNHLITSSLVSAG